MSSAPTVSDLNCETHDGDNEDEGTVMTAGSSMSHRLGRKSSGLKKISEHR